MHLNRRGLLIGGAALAGGMLSGRLPAVAADAPATLRFGVGPLQPTADDTKKAYDPFFRYVAEKMKADYSLVATTDWAGIAVALANNQIDLAWMGPWGYVLANNDSGARAIATALYDGRPVYHAIVIARPELKIEKWPEDAKGLRMSFADVGSTSGWLIPTVWFKEHGIDPKTYFKYSDGSTHAANEVAVSSGSVDLATDFDRNRNAMIESGKIAKDSNKIVWTSADLPNDAIAVRNGLDAGLTERLRGVLLGVTPAIAKTILPNHYTGFVVASHEEYRSIETAGIESGRLKKKP